MEIKHKLKALDAVTAVYDEFVRTQPKACTLRCTTCCTTHVTVTTLEAFKILEALFPAERGGLIERLGGQTETKRSRPTLTTNALAAICAAETNLPADSEEPPPAPCPLLLEGLCSIYALRPFNCRCFVSRVPCAEKGYADVDALVLSLNTVFLQTIEHLDADGCSGNLLDVLEVMSDAETRKAYARGALHRTGSSLIANRPMTVLMLPPEHRDQIEPVLRKLRQIRV